MRHGIFVLAGALALSGSSIVAKANSLSWDPFVIRNANSTGDVPTIVENPDGHGVTTTIIESGQKTGYGTTGLDGLNVGKLVSLDYDRLDAGTKWPYLNIWVSDGTRYALIAPVQGALHGGGYGIPDVDHLSLQTLGFNIYDNSDGTNYDWLYAGSTRDAGPGSLLKPNGDPVTLADIASLTIGEPSTHVVDSGAAQNGDGFNIIFGDTQGNFVQPVPYILDNISVAAVPLPKAAWGGLALMGGLGLVEMKKRMRRQVI